MSNLFPARRIVHPTKFRFRNVNSSRLRELLLYAIKKPHNGSVYPKKLTAGRTVCTRSSGPVRPPRRHRHRSDFEEGNVGGGLGIFGLIAAINHRVEVTPSAPRRKIHADAWSPSQITIVAMLLRYYCRWTYLLIRNMRITCCAVKTRRRWRVLLVGETIRVVPRPPSPIALVQRVRRTTNNICWVGARNGKFSEKERYIFFFFFWSMRTCLFV